MPELTAAPKRRKWVRILGWIILAGFMLAAVFYFVATSSGFFKGFVLPRVSRALNAKITVAEASISPFSQVVLTKLRVQTTGTEPLLTADEIRLAYHLGDIISGNYHIEVLSVNAPVIQLVRNADGTSNLTPLMKTNAATAKPATAVTPHIDIKKIALINATVRILETDKLGRRTATELSKVNLDLSDLKNGRSGKLTLGAGLNFTSQVPAPGVSSVLQGTATGAFSVGLAADLKPTAITGNVRIELQKAEGPLAELAGLVASLDCDITPTNLKQLALKFQKGASDLGNIRVSGPFDLAKSEGRLQLEVSSIDRQVLNLAGAASGIDFGTTTINTTNQIDVAAGGKTITVVGSLAIANMALTRTGRTTPMVNLHSDYDVTVNRAGNSAILRTLALNGTANQMPLLRAELTNPMNLGWGGAAGAASDSALKLSVTNLNLAQWKAFLGETISEGLLNLNASLLSQKGGQKLTFDVASGIAGLGVRFRSNQVGQTSVRLSARGDAADLDKINLADFHLDLSRQSQSLLTFAGSGQVEIKARNADLQFAANAALAPLLQAFPPTNITATSGALQLRARVTRRGEKQNVTGSLALSDLSGHFTAYDLEGFGVAAELEAELDGSKCQIRKAAGTLTEGARTGGKFELTGDFDSSAKGGAWALKLVDLNENTLRPFLAAALGDKKLVAISINATTSARFSPQGEASFKADLNLANLVVNDPEQKIPATPLAAGIIADASWKNSIADVRQLQISLTPTAKAANQLTLTGQIDLAQTNGLAGNLKIAAPSIDLTTYYNLFAANSPARPRIPATPPKTQPVPPLIPLAQEEPPAMTLPFRNFVCSLDIGRLYLRDLAITNLQTTAKIDGGRLLLKPFQLNLNGGPVSAAIDLNLGVPGYRYDVTLAADKVPVEPILSSFSSQHAVAMKGDLIASGRITGAGITGAGLRHGLDGQVALSFTNADIRVEYHSFFKAIIPYLALALRLDEMNTTPINQVNAKIKLGGGVIDLTEFTALGAAYVVSFHGPIPIADVVGNSPFNNLPLTLALSRRLADKSNLLPDNTPTNAAYVELPVFAHLTGTLDAPGASVDKLAVTGMMGRSIGGGLTGKAGDLLHGIGNLLTRQTPANTNVVPNSTTNQPGTNQPTLLNPFDLLRKVLPK